MTAQVNRVNPGGAAQTAHRDYHLGFMSPEKPPASPPTSTASPPPSRSRAPSPTATCRSRPAPRSFLPYSQLFLEGYLAFERPAFQDWFRDHHVQLPLAKGDLLFFNPALMHGAGANRTATASAWPNLPAGLLRLRPRHGGASTAPP